ncbi:uncharacterized protein DSM5745_07915 [Aspergillus mulundensis]|uniref:Uncharacterized protein n=1 Tax=Aspergillus mulundensis TaxID=1810919 RepID=A0A3D8RFC0_9EURO|nr:Uncharacterized protein DSM5745_07915 [Aspergillus mulundensis]RDW72743.1 Uncharacterized protein DSM5745_07915 [Aspergillus mulundensis]
MLSSLEKRGGPYASTSAGVGGLPTNVPDTIICAIFLVMYIGFAVTNMTILQKNKRRGHKFNLSGMLFGFCMARITTLTLRIVWANRPHNVRLGIAANIFVNAGILLVYIINLILAQRILRAKQPHIGWHPIPRKGSKVFYWLLPAALIMVITAIVVMFYTLDPVTRADCRDVQLTAITYLFFFTCLPLLHIIPAVALPRSKQEETFGEGSMLAKIVILTASTCLCILVSGFKMGSLYRPLRPVSNPAWYHGKPAFYVFNFVLEIMILCLLTFSRIDKRFWIPNGSTKPGDYSGMGKESGDESSERTIAATAEPKAQA